MISIKGQFLPNTDPKVKSAHGVLAEPSREMKREIHIDRWFLPLHQNPSGEKGARLSIQHTQYPDASS